jgi:tripartite-type tricarboxylate transporter receptor subunit TctC
MKFPGRRFLCLAAGAAALPVVVSRARAAIVGVLVATGAIPTADANEAFYQGKQLTIMVNFAPGGTTDIEARLLARHIARHIAGEPTVVVQNMDGAGGLNGANYLGVIAPKDGTMLGYLGGTAWQYASEPDRFRVDFRSYEFIAFQSSTTVYYVRTDVQPGMKVASDIIKAKSLVAGGNNVNNARDLSIRLTLDMLGVPHRYVTGYRSGPTARLALQRNEISFFAEPASAYRGTVEPQLVKTGMAVPVYFDPTYNGKSLSVSKQVDGLGLLPFQELHQKLRGAKPSGEMWEVYLACLSLESAMGRLIVLPPGAPQAAVAALRNAMQRLNNDKAFADDAAKALGFALDYEAGPDTNAHVRRALSIRPEIRAFVVEYIKKAGR